MKALFNYTNNTLFRLKVHNGGIIKAQVNVMNRENDNCRRAKIFGTSQKLFCSVFIFKRRVGQNYFFVDRNILWNICVD